MGNLPVNQNQQAIQNQQASQHLQAIFETHGYQKEVMADELFRVRKQQAEEYTKEQAEKEVFDFFEQDVAKQDAAKRLESERKSPMVSRETQLATLKGMVRDYEKGIRRPGLSAHTVIKAMELINRMTGYEAPIEHKHEVEHKVNVLPIIGESFKGELEPLEIIDLGEVSIANPEPPPTQIAPPKLGNPEPDNPEPPPKLGEPEDESPEELFP